MVGATKAVHPGFTYSAALSGIGGDWTYEELDHWINNPSAYARGTSMSFAGLRRDSDRVNVLAYLAANSPNAPALPAPLAAAPDEADPAEGDVAPVEGEADAAATDAVEGDVAVETAPEAPAEVAPEATETESAPVEAPAADDGQH